jgi:methionyl-tRNA formyltransferase
MTPFPGATAQLGADTVKLWQAHIDPAPQQPQPKPKPEPEQAPCGQILSADASGVRVACADGILTLTELQRAGGKRLPAADFLRGFALQPGQMFEVPRP